MYKDFKDYLAEAAPAILWYDVQAVGSRQGRVFGVGRLRGNVVLYHGYFGSCSHCGSWGEGGEPIDEAGVLADSVVYPTVAAARAALDEVQGELGDRERYDHPLHGFIDSYDSADMEAVNTALTQLEHDLAVLSL
jgi:hypothetical protein